MYNNIAVAYFYIRKLREFIMYKIVQSNTTIHVPGYIDRLNHSKIINDKRFVHTSYEHVLNTIPVQKPVLEDFSEHVVVNDQMEVFV